MCCSLLVRVLILPCYSSADLSIVTDMLLAILNTCSKEELADDMLLEMSEQDAEHFDPNATSSIDSTAMNRGAIHAIEDSEASKENSKNRIRQKILAVGRISRVFAVLRAESESVSELKGLMGTTKLPYRSLEAGAEGLKKQIHSFEDAKRSDRENERLPPTKEEKEREEKEKILKAIDEATHLPQSELDAVEAEKMMEGINIEGINI